MSLTHLSITDFSFAISSSPLREPMRLSMKSFLSASVLSEMSVPSMSMGFMCVLDDGDISMTSPPRVLVSFPYSLSGSIIIMSASPLRKLCTISFFAQKLFPLPDTPSMNSLPFRSVSLSILTMFLDILLRPYHIPFL